MSIFPYIYYMIESFHITNDTNRIALFAGLVTSVFAGAECLGAGFWGNLSDRIGRKPVLLTGLAGTGLSMIIFGFAPNLAVALLARALGGALNGNIGVLQTTVNEVVLVEAHQARAYAVMPTVWCLGAFIGSGLGGALADPVRNYPTMFQPGTLFDRFPYLLTNLVCTAVVIFSLIVGILFLEETHEEKRDRRDVGIEIGDWLLSRVGLGRQVECERIASDKDAMSDDETHTLIDDSPPDYSSTAASPELAPISPVGLPPPAYRSIEGTPRTSFSGGNYSDSDLARDMETALNLVGESATPIPSSTPKAFTKQVCLNVLGFGILAFHTISAEQLLPVLLSMPKSDGTPLLPFHFTGGFGLSTKAIGGILSVQGIIQMVATIVVFPLVNRRIGSLWTYRAVVLLYPFLYIAVPYLSLLPDSLRMPAVYLILVWKVTSQAFAFPSSSIMLANAAPSSKVLGTLNGAAASAASASRAFGPTLSGLLQAAGLSMGALGLPWWVNALVAAGGAVLSMCMVEEKRRVFTVTEKVSSTNDHHDNGVTVDHENMCSEPAGPTPSSPLLTRLSLDVRRLGRSESRL